MKPTRILAALAVVVLLSGCDSATEPSPTIYDTKGPFAPHAIGDTYAYQLFINGVLGDTAFYEVIKDTVINGETWQIHNRKVSFPFTEENSPEPISTREFVMPFPGGVRKLPILYGMMPIDESRPFDVNATDSVGMFVRDSTDVSVAAGVFKTASVFRSAYAYGDMSIYAPGVGMLYRRESNAEWKLLYAVIGGKRFGK